MPRSLFHSPHSTYSHKFSPNSNGLSFRVLYKHTGTKYYWAKRKLKSVYVSMDQNIAKQTFAFIACVDIIWLVVRVWIYLIYWISTIEQD